ncbi:MAG: iron uptake porin [Cyanobacteriota bacterium]|nr:iron uptake porin [Cyanobacteriota bacterium]
MPGIESRILLFITPIILNVGGESLAASITDYTDQTKIVSGIPSFSDLRTTDWAYQALVNLSERYGCIKGYGNNFFRGTQDITRFEAATLLNACLDQVSETTDEIKALLKEFERELVILRGRIDGLEVRVGELTATEFSTTTKLQGFTTMYLNGVAGTTRAESSAKFAILPQSANKTKEIVASLESADLSQGISFQYSQIISLGTSFENGRDRLGIDLYTSNLDPISASLFGFTSNNTGTYQTRLSFDAPPYNNTLTVGDLYYRFQPIKNLNITIDAVSSDISSEFLGGNLPFIAAYPYTQSISRFGRLDPIYYPYLGRKGVSADYQITKNFTAGFAYFGGYSGEPLFGGTYQSKAGYTRASQATIAQLSFWPTPQTKTFGMTLTYGKLNIPQSTPFGVTAQTGTALADQPFGSAALLTPPKQVALLTNTGMNSDTYGVGFGWHLGGSLYVTADTSYIQATATTNGLQQSLHAKAGDQAGIFQWNAALSINDLGGAGNVATLLVGNPYRVVSYSSSEMNPQHTVPWHIELSYTYRLTDNISLVPGFYYILNPEANPHNPPLGVFSLKSFIAF